MVVAGGEKGQIEPWAGAPGKETTGSPGTPLPETKRRLASDNGGAKEKQFTSTPPESRLKGEERH